MNRSVASGSLDIDAQDAASANSLLMQALNGTTGTEAIAALHAWVAASAAAAIQVTSASIVGSKPSSTELNATHHAQLAEALLALPRLQRVDLRGLKLGDGGAAVLARSLAAAPRGILRHVDLHGTAIGSSGAVALSRALELMPQLQSLDMSSNALGVDGVAALVNATRTSQSNVSSSVRALRLGGVCHAAPVASRGANAEAVAAVERQVRSCIASVAKLLGQLPHLEELDLSGLWNSESVSQAASVSHVQLLLASIRAAPGMRAPQQQAVATGISQDASVAVTAATDPAVSSRHSNSESKPRGPATGSHGSRHDGHLRSLSIARWPLSSPQARGSLAAAVHRLPHLEVLDVAHCHMADVGAELLAQVLLVHARAASESFSLQQQPEAKPLHKLVVSHNSLSQRGVAALLKASTVASLEHLDLSGNALGSEGAAVVAHAMQYMPSLQHLDLGDTAASYDGVRMLTLALQHVPHLRFLSIAHVDVQPPTGETVDAVVSGLLFTPRLETLYWSPFTGQSDSVSSDKTLTSLAALMSSGGLVRLQFLWLNHARCCGMSEPVRNAFFTALQHTPALRRLEMRACNCLVWGPAWYYVGLENSTSIPSHVSHDLPKEKSENRVQSGLYIGLPSGSIILS